MPCSFWPSLHPWLIRLGAAACVLMSGVLLGASTQAGVIYTEDFEVADGSGGGFASYGWNVGYGAAAVEMGTSMSQAGHDRYGYSRTTAIVGEDGEEQPIYAAANALAWTMEPGDISTAMLQSILFDIQNSATNLRVAVKIGDDWFATDDTFADTSWTRRTFDWTRDAADWRDVTYNQGVELSLGAVRTSDLPSGNVSAFGFFTDGYGASQYSGASRFDNIEIVVPEPSSLIVLWPLVAMAIAVPLRRRRRRA